ncbi:MAG: EAL domain-containing protein [Alphaproteobacteria bacterium]|nr:EAL domain-containing protein [Alphaproteobacteria bacterium]
MRVWEVEEKKETPSDLVLEQDFILRVRRMQRLGMPCLILNFVLAAIKPLSKSKTALEDVQKRLKAYASLTNGVYYEMSNGDSFLVWEKPGDEKIIAAQAIEAALSAYKENPQEFLLTYKMPEHYTELRERTNSYIEEARARATVGDIDRVDESSGHLTAKNVEQIERLLGEIDIRRYGRTQSIYRDDEAGWSPVAEEYFISFADLRREHFPRLDVARSEHFFMALCSLLDTKLLGSLTNAYGTIAERRINLNLSISSIMGLVFANFVRVVPHDQRNLIGFELHCGDLLQDFVQTLDAIALLKHEGFRVAIDGVTPSAVPFIDFNKFQVDRIKILASKDQIAMLKDADIRQALESLPKEKLVFFRCDNERTLDMGRTLGVNIFQGWLIDDLAQKKRT